MAFTRHGNILSRMRRGAKVGYPTNPAKKLDPGHIGGPGPLSPSLSRFLTGCREGRERLGVVLELGQPALDSWAGTSSGRPAASCQPVDADPSRWPSPRSLRTQIARWRRAFAAGRTGTTRSPALASRASPPLDLPRRSPLRRDGPRDVRWNVRPDGAGRCDEYSCATHRHGHAHPTVAA